MTSNNNNQNNNSIILFESIFNSFISSFLPFIDQVFSEFDEQISSGKFSTDQIDSILEDILIDFPGNNKTYKHIIDTITQFASSNTQLILSLLCSKFKNEVNRKQNTPASVIVLSSLKFNNANIHHFYYLHYLTLIVLSDLIYSVYLSFPNRQVAKLVPCGFALCTKVQNYQKLQKLLIDKWSYLFYHLSATSMEEITRNFEQSLEDNNAELIYKLISHTQCKQQMADAIFQAIHQAKKKKTLNSEILTQLSFILSRIECSQNTLSEFFKLAGELKSQSSLKDGCTDLKAVLFNRLPGLSKKQQVFYQKKIYKHAHNSKNVQRYLLAFLRLIQGDISKATDPEEGTDPLAFINFHSHNNGNESFLATFMKIFYPKANFSVCPELFRDVLVHLASLNISEFISDLVPKFLVLEANDPKFIVFLMTIPIINRPDFLQKSFCKAKPKQISELNKSVINVIKKKIPLLEKIASNKAYIYVQDAFQILPTLDVADHEVEEFVVRNGYENFHPYKDKVKNNLRSLTKQRNKLSFECILLQCIPTCFGNDDLKDKKLQNTILQLTVNEDQQISQTANEVFTSIINKNEKVKASAIKVLLKILKNVPGRELLSCLLQHLFQSLIKPLSAAISKDSEMIAKPEVLPLKKSTYDDIASTVFFCLISDIPRVRTLALRILKYIEAIGVSDIYAVIMKNNERLTATVCRSIIALNIPPKPSSVNPPLGKIQFDQALSSRYFDIWIIFFAEIIGLFIENKDLMKRLLRITSKFIHKVPKFVESKQMSVQAAAAIYLVHLNAITVKADYTAITRQLLRMQMTLQQQAGNGQLGEEEEEEAPSENMQGDDDDVEFPIIEEAESLFQEIIDTGSPEVKRTVLQSLRYLNWRIIPSVLPAAMKVEQTYYKELSTAFSLIIQTEENFQHLISHIFGIFLEFISLLQDYFIKMKINHARTIHYDYEKLDENQEICLNYCILISAAFNNIATQLPEEQFPVSYRQILFNFLIHWAQLPDKYEKLRSYALNALIPITHTGTIFTNGFEIDLNIFDMMIKCQLSGFPVLDSLLIFHFDVLLEIYVKQAFLKPKREAQVFIDAIISALAQCNSPELLHHHVGFLILLACIKGQEKSEISIPILVKLAELFLNRSNRQPYANSGTNTNDAIQMITNMTTFNILPTLFQFATEQVISAGFEVIKESKKDTVIKQIVEFLKIWFTKLRLLPKGTYIIQGVPMKFRVYNVLGFMDAMLNITKILTDEQLDSFTDLWMELLLNADNKVVILSCIAELDDATLKEKIFSELLDRDQVIIAKYLSKMCSFRYWYFAHSTKEYNVKTKDSPSSKIHLNSSDDEDINTDNVKVHEDQKWLQNVLTRAFANYVEVVAPICFTLTLHYALLYIEEARELFETLTAILDIDSVDEMYFWSPELSDESMTGFVVVEQIAESFRSQNQTTAIEKWAQEAMRWVVGCNDIKLAYRSLVILNGIGETLEQDFELLLFEAVSYHLSQFQSEGSVFGSDESEDIIRFVAETFKTLNSHLDVPDLANLAFHYASSFIGCTTFEDNCLEKAFPIFLNCVSAEVLKTQAISVLVDAFYPFAKKLEVDKSSQETLLQIIQLIDAKELYLVAAVFYLKPLPFININKTLEEILMMKFTVDQINKALWFFQAMLKTASRPLVDSILILTTKLILKFGKRLNRVMLVPIFLTALHNIAAFQSAVDFLQAVSSIDPSIATLRDDSQIHTKIVSDVCNEIKQIVDFSGETVPFTNCKDLHQLHGMISMSNPPKIIPFSTRYDMYLGMKKEQKKFIESSSRPVQKWSSTVSLTSQIMSNKSLIFATSYLISGGASNYPYKVLEKKKVIKNLLDLPSNKDEGNWKFIISLVEFDDLENLEKRQ